jgi:hypothetical protein
MRARESSGVARIVAAMSRTRGPIVVMVLLLAGGGLAAVGAWMRGRGEPRLPLEPGTILLVTAARGTLELGPFASGMVEYTAAHGVSSDVAATRAAIATGRMPRECGVARAGDPRRRDVPTIAERLVEQHFESATFTQDPAGAAGGGGSAAVAWLVARGDSPGFAWLDLEDAAAPAAAGFLEKLAESPLAERVVLVVVELGDPRSPRLRLRVPGGLLTPGFDRRDVSLLDVAPTLLELYGVSVPPDLMEPFLLAPRTRGPRFFLFTRPLAPAGTADDGSDAVELLAAGHRYALDPSASPPEQVDGAATADPALRDELRRVLESAFRYRVESDGKSAIARFVERPQPR